MVYVVLKTRVNTTLSQSEAQAIAWSAHRGSGDATKRRLLRRFAPRNDSDEESEGKIPQSESEREEKEAAGRRPSRNREGLRTCSVPVPPGTIPDIGIRRARRHHATGGGDGLLRSSECSV